jgi:methylmalonyl-CoA mutase
LDQADVRPSEELWREAASRVLKGAPFENLISHTLDGLQMEPLYGPGAGEREAPLARIPAEESPWDIRARADHADPARLNALVLEALEGGASSVLIGAPESAGALARALDGVLLEAATVALDAGLAGPEAALSLAEAARGSPAARLALHLDPLGAFAEAGASPGPIDAHLEAAARTAADLAPAFPRASLFLATGRAAHEAGGSAAQELGTMAAAAVAYARALAAAGLPMEDALAGVVLGVSIDGEVLTSIAKLRAAREIWARIAAACGAPMPARIEARSSRRMLAAMDPWTNLLRLTVAGFAGAVGGADAIVLGTFTDALGAPAERARRLARNTQLILMQECGLGELQDPAAGAWALEALTDQLARQGWAELQAIEREGGLAAALASGRIASDVAETRQAREAVIADRQAKILGVTAYPDPHPLPVEVEPAEPPAPPAVTRRPGPDSRCPPLTPVRLAQTAEQVAEDLSA